MVCLASETFELETQHLAKEFNNGYIFFWFFCDHGGF